MCWRKQITSDMVKIIIVKMASMKKNDEKWKIGISITLLLIITDKQNSPINICFVGKKYNKIS